MTGAAAHGHVGAMLSVIVVAGDAGERLPGVLAALTAAAVQGLVREVAIVGGGPPELLTVLQDETGAELAADLEAAIAKAKSEELLVVPAEFRPFGDWEGLAAHLRDGGREAVLKGAGGGFLRRAPYALLLPRKKAAGLAHPDLQRLRRVLGREARRLR